MDNGKSLVNLFAEPAEGDFRYTDFLFWPLAICRLIFETLIFFKKKRCAFFENLMPEKN